MEVLSELEKGLTRNELDFDQNINDYKFLSWAVKHDKRYMEM